MNKAFTLRIVRCLLIGIGAFIMLLAADVKIRSGIDVAMYILGAGALWYVFEIIVMGAKKPAHSKEVVEQFEAQKEVEQNARFEAEIGRRRAKQQKATKSALGQDHF